MFCFSFDRYYLLSIVNVSANATKLFGVTALCLKFTRNLKSAEKPEKKATKRRTYLEARRLWIREVQDGMNNETYFRAWDRNLRNSRTKRAFLREKEDWVGLISHCHIFPSPLLAGLLLRLQWPADPQRQIRLLNYYLHYTRCLSGHSGLFSNSIFHNRYITSYTSFGLNTITGPSYHRLTLELIILNTRLDFLSHLRKLFHFHSGSS